MDDTDAGGVVYHANYLKLFERTRTEYLRSVGIDKTTLWQDHQRQFVIAKAELQYKKPLRLDDFITVTAQITKAGKTSLIFEQHMTKGPELIASATITAVCINEAFKPAPLPAIIRTKLL
jgi:acyl-CoA thioester hydrolase, YbgC/YbaW family